MPRLSFVLAVHGGQAFVRQCLTSVLSQAPRDVEAVVVDDASPDHGPEILDEIAAGDARVRVRHLAERVGFGEARNLAVDLSRGRYVWFVEITDDLPEGAVAAVTERLGTSRPDVLLVDHERVDWSGQVRPSAYGELLAGAAEQATVSLDRRPALAALGDVAWNKVVRRELLLDLGVRFGPGGDPDLSVTYPVMLAASRIALLDRVCYRRRDVRGAGVQRGHDGSAFDTFAQLDAVFAFAESHGDVVAERRGALVPSMVRHLVVLLDDLPVADRKAFFRRMTESCRRHVRPGDPAPPGRLLTLQLDAVRRGSYRAFRLLGWAAARKGGLRRRREQLARWRGRQAARFRRWSLQRYYRIQRRQPLDQHLAVFAAYWYRGYACNPAAIYEKARELVPGFSGVWVVESDAVDALPDGVPYVVADTKEYYRVLARGTYFVNNVNFPNHLVKRPGQVHVQTHHGTPLKQMGLDLRTSTFSAARLNFRAMMRRCDRWDYSISANTFSTEVWERVYPTDFTSLETGYPRNDVLVTASADDVSRRREALGIRPGQRAILYAPTHREYNQGFVPLLDLARVADDLGDEYVIMARTHYFYEADEHLQALHQTGRILDVAAYPTVEDLCLAADVLVTDYSSIMFDYAVLDRPVVVYAPDWEVYRAMRGVYFDLVAEPPGAVARTEDGLLDVFRSGRDRDADAARLRKAFRDRFCRLEDGHAAERVVRGVWLRETPAAERGDQ